MDPVGSDRTRVDDPPAGARRPLMALGLFAFLFLGGIQALYGPSFASLQARHGIGLAEVGAAVSAHFLGGFVGVIAAGAALTRYGYRTLLVVSSTTMAAGALVVAASPQWPGVLVGAGGIGLGFGLAVVLYNFLFARAFAPRGTAAVNLINAAFGVGAVLFPALVGVLTIVFLAADPGSIDRVAAWGFGGSALIAGVLAWAATRVPWLPGRSAVPRSSRPAGAAPIMAALPFGALLFVYVAGEASVTAWAPTHVASQLDVARGALAASIFWATMTVGRLAAAALAGRWRPRDVVVGASLLGLAGLLLAAVPGASLVGYAVAGLGLGPVFPTSIVWVSTRFGDRAEQVGSWVLAAGNLGPVVGAPAIGLAAAGAGPEAVPWLLAATIGVLVAIVVPMWVGERRGARAAPSGQGTSRAEPARRG